MANKTVGLDATALEAAKVAFSLAENNPNLVPCSHCAGKGHQHGYGEDHADPEWCTSCGGGCVELADGEDDRPLRDGITAYLSALPHAGVSEEMVEALRKISELRYAEDANEPFDEALDLADAALALSSQHAEAVPVGWLDIDDEARAGKRILLLWKPFGGISEHVELGWWSSAKQTWTNTYGKPFGGDPDKWAPLAPFSPVQADAEPGIKALPPYGVVIYHDDKGAEQRVSVKEYKGNNYVTLALYIGDHWWREAHLPPEQAHDVARLIMSMPCMAETVPTTSPAKGGAEVDADVRGAAHALLRNLWIGVVSGIRTHEENWREFEHRYPGVKWLHEALRTSAPVGKEQTAPSASDQSEA